MITNFRLIQIETEGVVHYTTTVHPNVYQYHVTLGPFHTRALHWVPIPQPMLMPTHAQGFWVGMGAMLLVMLRMLPLWVD